MKRLQGVSGSSMSVPSQAICEFGPYRMDAAKRLLLRDGEAVSLTPKCFEILLALVENSGQVVDKEGLMHRVWPDSFVEEGNLTYNISVLRKALGEKANEHRYIVTVPGRGYQFVASVSPVFLDSTEREPDLNETLEKGGAAGKPQEILNAGTEASPSHTISSAVFVSRIKHHKLAAFAALIVMIAAVAGFGLYLRARNTAVTIGTKAQSNLAEPFLKMKITRLTTAGKATVAAISPDGRYVAHAMGDTSRQSLWLRHIATGSDKEIVPQPRLATRL
jgi:DNA-binding winged helix-turn-helix (wHTH) protein